jgi:hypothetical protein
VIGNSRRKTAQIFSANSDLLASLPFCFRVKPTQLWQTKIAETIHDVSRIVTPNGSTTEKAQNTVKLMEELASPFLGE